MTQSERGLATHVSTYPCALCSSLRKLLPELSTSPLMILPAHAEQLAARHANGSSPMFYVDFQNVINILVNESRPTATISIANVQRKL